MYSVPTKMLGAVVHRQQGTVDRKVVLFLSLGGIPATLLGLGVPGAEGGALDRQRIDHRARPLPAHAAPRPAPPGRLGHRLTSRMRLASLQEIVKQTT